MRKISFLIPNLAAFSCFMVNIHLEEYLMECDTSVRFDEIWYNKRISISSIKHMSTIFRTQQVNKL